MEVIYLGEHWYVDCTSQQFQDLYKDIPDYYISRKSPKWYYPDSRNPSWRGVLSRVNRKFEVPIKQGDCVIKVGVVSFVQLDVMGVISDFIWRRWQTGQSLLL